jgi:hypothetical protein
MSGFGGRWRLARKALLRAAILVTCLLLPGLALGEDKAQLNVTAEAGYGRLVLSFPGRNELPDYNVKYENGVLAVEFSEPISLLLPDVSLALPDYVSVARVDPDRKGVRFGLRTALNINRMEAGERLFIDLMPMTWQGLPPGLPAQVVADLAQRAKDAERLAEQKRKAEEAKTLNPVATLRVGRNPTFLRVEFNWNVDTKGKFAVKGGSGLLDFDWPVPVDLYELKADMPPELKGAVNSVSPDGSRITFRVAEGVTPRFYETSPRQFIVDIDIAREAGLAAAVAAEEKAEATAKALEEAAHENALAGQVAAADLHSVEPAAAPASLTPQVSTVGATVRVAFPFDRDTAAAVFRRGNTVWMLFDTDTSINVPEQSAELSAIASEFSVIPAGDTKVVRLDLSAERLATLGSEGRSWVLSLGDVLLNPTEPLTLERARDQQGEFEMTADLNRPAKVHQFRDPVVGDLLTVVTAYPPSRGASRNLSYVDFTALRSVHGLVIKPQNDELQVAIAGKDAVITTRGGLTLSARAEPKVLDSGNASQFRGGFIDLLAVKEDDPARMVERRETIIGRAADSEGRLRDVARLELAQFYIANQFSYEAIGVLDVLDKELRTEDLRKKVRLTRGIADVLAGRPSDALKILGTFDDEVDALIWRTIAKSENYDFRGARLDAVAAESVIEAYPGWVQTRFLLAGIRSAVETRDSPMAERLLARVEFAKLDPEQASLYQLLQGRLAEAEARTDEAIDTYGQVIAADFRPTRAEAVYRTLLLLDKAGRINLDKATQTLAAEAMLWRGNPLEAEMDKLLAELYFRNHQYREGFDVVKEAVANYPESEPINGLLAEAQDVFGELYLNGAADAMGDVDALSLYYDFRQLTPPGSRGDEMIRNLARRLVKVDLLTQAADLLEYQIDSRLKGVAQAQIAADLAVIRIADRDPEGALRVLNRTRLADLSPLLERQRRILEARALIDAGREDLALDLLSRIKGHDADLLRVDGFWKAKNYDQAAEMLEIIYSPGEGNEAMDTAARMNIVKAAVGFVLVNDKIGLSRLRSKFGDEMSKSAEWPMFDYVTSDIAPSSIEFRKVAREVSGLDSLDAFLASYRQMYAGGDAMTPNGAAAAVPAA